MKNVNKSYEIRREISYVNGLKQREWLMVGRILFLFIPILGDIAMFFYQDAS